MTRDDVLTKVRDHLSAELDVNPSEITEATRFREDLDADSLDLYELVMELEDGYGHHRLRGGGGADQDRGRRGRVRAGARTSGVVRWGRRRGYGAGNDLLRLIEALPDDLAREAFTHASWTEERARSYGRLAFLGDSVLGLAVATEVFSRFADSDIGPLTKIHNQAVSGRACADVALGLGLDKRLGAMEPEHVDAGIGTDELVASERAMASVAESAIGACYLTHGYEATAAAVIAAFGEEIDNAASDPADHKSSLQELLARRGARVTYEVVQEAGPPHERRFEVTASVDGEAIGSGAGRSKKAAEQAAAEQALERMR